MPGAVGKLGRRIRPTGTCLAVALMIAAIATSSASRAQIGPVEHYGFLEYRYGMAIDDGGLQRESQLGTWQANASTYLWRPWIVQVNASLGLTRTVTQLGDGDQAETGEMSGRQNSNLLTGRLLVDVFRQSRFPFSAFAERTDSRVDGNLSGLDLLTQTYGFRQLYAARGGGRFALDYRRSEVDDLRSGGLDGSRSNVNDIWQLEMQKSLGRNQLRYSAKLTDLERSQPAETRSWNQHTLQHQFRPGNTFYLEDTTFFSKETLSVGDFGTTRSFLQVNGISTWRPVSDKPLMILGRGLLQATETGNGASEQKSRMMNLSGTATYQYSDSTLFAANAGVTIQSVGDSDDTTETFQTLRTNYNSDIHDVWDSNYRWNAFVELGNSTGVQEAASGSVQEAAGGSVQEGIVSFGHNLTKYYEVGSDYDLEINLSQQLSVADDTEGRDLQTVAHVANATLSRQMRASRNFARLSLTDRRTRGYQRHVFQLVNLQASRSTRYDRFRSWRGSVTMQYGHIVAPDNGIGERSTDAVSYSANLIYSHTNLFDVRNLNFMSELRLLSSDFVTDEPFDDAFDPDESRTDAEFRNRLDYRIGLLQLRLEANWRQINDDWTSMVFLSVRRYYGIQ